MRGTTGKCPGCDKTGTVAEPCHQQGCQKRGLHYISDAQWERAHADGNSPDPVIGQMVGDFLVVNLIGVGGFGKVYLAHQAPLLRLKGALKLIDVSTDDPEFSRALLEKFQAEAEVLAQLSHPNIVRLLKYGFHQKRPYLVMEFVDQGRTLRDEIHARTTQERGFSADETLEIFDQVLNGLQAAHEESIIHRDIKPENIMLQSVVGNPHHARLLDFGLAKFVEHQTDTRWHLGSPSYMAPEQIARKNLGPWTDLYAVSVILFELLSGRRPFPGETEDQVLVKKVDDDFDPLAEIEDLDFPAPAMDFLARGLSRDPDDRFQSVDALREPMESAVESLADRLGDTGTKLSAETARLKSEDLIEIEELEEIGSTKHPQAPADPGTTRRASSGALPLEAASPETDGDTKRAPSSDYPPEEFGGADSESESESEPVSDPDGDLLGKYTAASRRRRIGLVLIVMIAVGAVGAIEIYGPTTDWLPNSVFDRAESLFTDIAGDDEAMQTASAEPDSESDSDEQLNAARPEPDGEMENSDPDAGDDTAPPPMRASQGHDREIVDVALGKFHSCILLRGGNIRCWGANRERQLGLGHRDPVGGSEPAESADLIEFGEPAIAVSAAGDYNASYTCAILESRALRCWGSNHVGQLGLGDDIRRTPEEQLPGDIPDVDVGAPVVRIATGAMQYASHTCALTDAGELRCWGDNRYGQLGLGHTRDIGQTESPVDVGPVDVDLHIDTIVVGKFQTCVLATSGQVRCWGRNNYGQLGLGHTDNVGDDEVPADVDPIDLGGRALQISVGRLHVCALIEEHGVRCWGWNEKAQLGLGHTDNVGDDELPTDAEVVDVGGRVEKISAGNLHTCALLDGGRVRCWGDNRFGQLGYGHRRTIGDDELPADAGDIPLGGRAVDIATGDFHTCAILEDDSLRCWGFNETGQLGYGHTDHIGFNETPASVGPVPAY